MNSLYFEEYANLLERAFSFAYKKNYSWEALQRKISYSPFFQALELPGNQGAPIIGEEELLRSLFPDLTIDLEDLPVYSPCRWAAESYLHILIHSGLSFEAIFLHLPISRMLSYFPLYHEMDASALLNEFDRLKDVHTVFALLVEKYAYSLTEVAKQTGIPYPTLDSWKKGKRDIRKGAVENIQKLASFFHVRIETIAQLPKSNPSSHERMD